jgi:argonaute-like protein implicated in RNA metabolism and viral defense
MQAFVLTNQDVTNILRMSTQDVQSQKLLTDLVRMMQCDITEYMYNVLSCYLLHYIPLGDMDMRFEKHNQIFERFEQVGRVLSQVDYDVRSVNHLESIMNSGAVEAYGNFDPDMSTDVHRQLIDYHTQTEGSRFIDRMQDQICEEVDSVMEMTTYMAKEIESRYLRHTDEDRTSNVLFGIRDRKLIVFVD